MHASEVLLDRTKIVLVVVWIKDLRAVDLEAGIPPRAHCHSQGRNGKGLTLARGLNWQRSGFGKLKMQTLGHAYVVQFNAYIDLDSLIVPITQMREISVKVMMLLA